MKELIRDTATLAVTCAVAGGLLAGVYSFTAGRITAQAQEEEQASLRQLVPRADSFEPVAEDGKILYYRALDKTGSVIAFLFKASAKGYSGHIETLVAMDTKDTVTAIKVLEQNETPGLGSRVTEPPFTGQFSGRSIAALEEVQAITGATISSTAVINSVAGKARRISSLINASSQK